MPTAHATTTAVARRLDRLPSKASHSEVIVLRAADRSALVVAARRLADWAEANPQVELGDLAFTLSHDLASTGETLGIVATSVADFAKKLRSATDRLSRPDCKQIRDSSGVYYFSEPLGGTGRLAFLFPGEGAQYLDMLGDIAPRFAVIRDYLEWCDVQALEISSRGEPLSQLLCAPEEWTAAEFKLAEAEFADLATAMFAVSVADWSFRMLLEHLGIFPEATAGHSMGEFAALSAAGAVDDATMPQARIVQTIEALEANVAKDRSAAPETALLAVATGRATVESIARKLMLPNVYVGMDNCPHQAVVVGISGSVAAIESELKSRGILYEKLPFHRPYHTPLFAPLLGRLDAMFDGTVFGNARMPVYSCTTAAPFPQDPAAIRSLAVAHWAAPVEFTRTIERMHADGIRLFVESGPRGNWSAFVEDILRGKRFAALPANLARRPGMVQFNHLLAQLAAHGVDARWDRLYAERELSRLSMDAAVMGAPLPRIPELPTDSHFAAAVLNSDGTSPSNGFLSHDEANDLSLDERSAVIANYLTVMDQFLDLQHDMMTRFFGGQHAESDLGLVEAVAVESAPDDRSGPGLLRPLLGELVAFEPGKSLLARRTLKLDEICFAGDHTVGGRRVSRVDPNQHGLPVMPMTGSLEMMAEHAELLAPGLMVVAIENVRLARWLAVDDPPHTVEVSARLETASPGRTAVRVEIHDLGENPTAPQRKLAAQATVVFALHRATKPTVGAFLLQNERPCRISIEVLYRNLFHGEKFLGVKSMPRVGDDGIEAEIEVMERHGLIGGDDKPAFILDPVLLDVVMHPLAAWHLEQPDQAGRILLPIGLKRLEVYSDAPGTGMKLTSRGTITEQSARHFVKNFEAVDADGRVLYRFDSVQYWRFYVPFGDVNFHGPKDEYFLSKKLPLPASMPQTGEPSAVLMWFDPPLDIRQPVIRGAAAKVTLGVEEFQTYRTLQLPDDAIDRWLFGRICAKDAARQLWFERFGKRHYPADLIVNADDAGNVRLRWRAPGPDTLPDYLADCNRPLPKAATTSIAGQAFALAAFSDRVGIAAAKLADIAASKVDAVLPILSDTECDVVAGANGEKSQWLVRLQLAKSAVAQAVSRPTDAIVCKDVDMASGAVLAAVDDSEIVTASTTIQGEFLLAMVLG